MTVAFEIKRLARLVGIALIFAFIGPLAATAVFVSFVLIVGVPMLDLVLDIVELQTIKNWLSVAVFLLVFFALASATLPSIVAGIGFAIAALYFGLTSLWTALIIVGAVVIGVVALGFFMSPSESSPLLLPSVKGLQQGAVLALFLSIPAAVAAFLSWFFSRPLHRSS